MKPIYKSTDQIPPGRYLRRMPGFQDTVMEIFYRGGTLTERAPMGTYGEPKDNLSATYESVEVAK